ncbi:hypothetical protein ACFV1W_21365 [Kitasatospora sp. NPDC059648]|uniref:hypothetical protein n=1 Tax=Kitasatospora sp. NPDC059648 TaxID=3346894 RepID=UPI0036CEC666
MPTVVTDSAPAFLWAPTSSPRSAACAHLAEGTVGTAEEYATFDGASSVERDQELFDAVADLVDVRGCPACPTAHPCTREPEAQPA